MPFLLAIRAVFGFLGKNWKVLAPAALAILGLAFFKGFLDAREREIRNEETLICNENVLEDQLESERQLREDAETLAQSLNEQIVRLRESELERRQYLTDLERQLTDIEDDNISPRTRELIRRLNQRTWTYVNTDIPPPSLEDGESP